MTLTEILGTGAFAGFISFVLNFFGDWQKEARGREWKAKYQALELSNKLMILSLRCREILDHFQLEEAPEDQEAPDPPEFPSENLLELTRSMTELHVDDLSRLADLEMRRISQESELRFGWSTGMDLDDVGKFRLRQIGTLRDEASALAATIRKRHKLPVFEFQKGD